MFKKITKVVPPKEEANVALGNEIPGKSQGGTPCQQFLARLLSDILQMFLDFLTGS
jgi:hypothetical protein